MKNKDGGLKVPLFDLYQCHDKVDAKISLVPKHQLIVPSTLLALATNILTYKVTKIQRYKDTKLQRYKATKIHTLTPLTYELFFQNSSITVTILLILSIFFSRVTVNVLFLSCALCFSCNCVYCYAVPVRSSALGFCIVSKFCVKSTLMSVR